MTRANQFTSKPDRARLRFWQGKASEILDAEEQTLRDKLVIIHRMKEENISNAQVAGMFGLSPSRVQGLADQGKEIVSARKGAHKST